MTSRVFKVHTDTLGRLEACIKKAMYGVSKTAFTKELPKEFLEINVGDMVFISEREISGNALFGPFYVINNRPGIGITKRIGNWLEIDVNKSDAGRLAYWVEMEKRNYCLLFDDTVIDRISIVWPNDWLKLQLTLPSWGLVPATEATKLIDFAVKNEMEAKEFLRMHVW